MLEIAATCLVITALLAYLNHRFVELPTTIGVMAAALIISLGLIGLDAMGIAQGVRQYEESFLRSIDFSNVLMQGMLSLLLFAAALHVDVGELKTHRLTVTALAMLGRARWPRRWSWLSGCGLCCRWQASSYRRCIACSSVP